MRSVFISAMVALASIVALDLTRVGAAETGRETISFDQDWWFHRGDVVNGQAAELDAAASRSSTGAPTSPRRRLPRMPRSCSSVLKLPIKGMGCNAIRTSHNPPAPELLDLCDRLGLVVMDEAFDEWKSAKTRFGYGRFFDEWSERDLTSMLRRDRNHPCVVMWSIGNEINEQGAANGYAMSKRLVDICHREDPTRPTVSACNNPGGADHTGYAKPLDVSVSTSIAAAGARNHWCICCPIGTGRVTKAG